MRATQVQPIIEDSGLNEEDYKVNQDALERPKCSAEGKDFITSNFQELSRPDSRSKNTYVKLWAHKESQRNDQTPKRIKLQIGSLNCGDTLRFLEAEKVRVIREIRQEHEKRLGRARDTSVLVGTRDTTCKEEEHTQELASYNVHEEGRALRSNRDRSVEPMQPEQSGRGLIVKEQKRSEDMAAEMKEKRRREADDTFSQELRALPMSREKTKQKGEKELIAVDENRAQPEARAPRGAEQDNLAGVLGGQVTGTREQTGARGHERASDRPISEMVKKSDRTAAKHSKENKCGTTALTSHQPSSRDFKNYISCQGDKWAGKFENAARNAEVNKGRAAQQGEGQDEEKELQKRALFHLEALRRIEQTYNNRINRGRNDNVRTKRPNETPLRHPEYWDNNLYSGVPETQKNQLRKLQKKGQGGLNALLAPVFEEEIQRKWQNLDENSPTNSYTEKQVLIFRRMKMARLRAAEEQIAVVKARAQQRRAQLKTTLEKVEKPRALGAVHKKEKGKGGEGFKAQKDSLPTNLTQERLFTHTLSTNFKTLGQSIRRIKEVHDKTRAEEELERERRRRTKLKEEERRARLRRGGPDRASVELYGKLNGDERIEMLGLPSAVNSNINRSLKGFQKLNGTNRFSDPQFSPHTVNSRLKGPLDSSQKLNGSNRFKHPQFSPHTVNRRFKSPLTSPRKAVKTTALEHFASWERELRTAQQSRSRSKERSTERRVTINDDLSHNTGKTENSGPKSGSTATGRLYPEERQGKSPARNQSPENMLSNEAIPDHYNSVGEDCTCELKHKKERKEITRVKAIDEKTTDTAKGAHKRENCQSLNWLGKLYNTITSFS